MKEEMIMIIKYHHKTEPNTEKTYNTVRELMRNAIIVVTGTPGMDQETFDDLMLIRFKQDKKKGIILSYRIEN